MATKKARAARKTGATKKSSVRAKSAKKAVRKVAKKRASAAAAKRTRAARPATRGAKKSAAAKPKAASRRTPSRKQASPSRGASARRAAAPPAADTSAFPCGDDAVRAATGKGWSEWLSTLDAAGAAARSMDHQQIWDIAMRSLPGSAGWWGQMVSVGYERARGLREKHQTSVGDFQASISKTLPVPLFAAFAAWADKNLRKSWLDAPDLDFTKLNVGRNIRARWPDGSALDIRFNASGPDKCQIVVDTTKLADAEAVQKAKAFWQDQLERLQAYFRV
jgi:hypothetical protein